MKNKTNKITQIQKKLIKSIVLIVGIGCFFIASPAHSQELPVREYTNPDEIVTFDRTTSYRRALDVINRFAQEYADKLIIDRSVYEGNIGISIPPMHWRDALELILNKNYLQLVENREYFEILPYADSADPAQAGLSPPDTALSTGSKEIRIHAIFFDGNRRALQEIGVDWSTLTNNVPDGVGSFFGQQGGGGEGGDIPVTGDAFEGPFVSINAKGAQSVSQNVFSSVINFGEVFGSGIRVQALFSAFEADNMGTILASPSVRVLEGETGNIQVGQDFSINQRDFAGNVLTQFYSVGTILNVVPQVIEVQDTTFVHLDIGVERSTVQPDAVSTIINTQNAETQVLLLDGETTVIAGLYQTQKNTVRRGVPILKDLPAWFFGLRYIFGYTSNSYETRELVVLLKAEIVPNIEKRMNKKLAGKFRLLQKERIRIRKDVIKYRESLENPRLLPTDDPKNIFEEDNELDLPEDVQIDEKNYRPPVEEQTEYKDDTDDIHEPEMETDNFELQYPDEEQQTDVSNTISPEEINYEFYVIGGSFKSKNNARDFHQELSGLGYEPKILVNVEDGFYMVSYKGFNERREALLFLSEIKRETNSGAWIFDNY